MKISHILGLNARSQLFSYPYNKVRGKAIAFSKIRSKRILKKAGIEKAKGLIATLGDDSDNIYLVITTAELNPNLDIAAKAEEEHAVDRLHKVGANIVVLPQVVGGRQLANAFLELEKTEELETVSKKKITKS